MRIKVLLFSLLFLLFLIRFRDKFSFLLDYLPSLTSDKKVQNIVRTFRRLSSISQEDPIQLENASQPMINNLQPKKKVFYENQRWYLALGFTPTSIERPNFSDGTGSFEIIPSKI